MARPRVDLGAGKILVNTSKVTVPAKSHTTIGDRLEHAKQAHFIGRQDEVRVFERALADTSRSWLILNIFGPGGIGKSTLLDAFRRSTEASNSLYLYIDAPDCGNSAEIFIAQLCAMLTSSVTCEQKKLFDQLAQIAESKQVVIAIDTFEEIGDMNRWIREYFLPKLPGNCMIVIAGRHALTDLWQAQPVWHSLIKPLALENFDQQLTHEFLQQNGVSDQALIERAWHYTAGYPLALSLSVMLAKREGQTSIPPSYNDANIVTGLTQRWLREIPDEHLRPFIEAAAIVRNFNQDLLEQISGRTMNESDFHQLLCCSFVRSGLTGWSLHNLVRAALMQELSQRSPEKYALLRIRALSSLAHIAIQPCSGFDRGAALQEFFYLLGDSLVRAALYNEETEPRSGLYLESAGRDDIEPLQQYMQEWRIERGVLSNVNVNLYDQSSNESISQQIISEPREPEFLNIPELVEQFPGAIRLLKDQTNQLLGLTIVLPINAKTIDYLKAQPVTGRYFSTITEQQLEEMQTPADQTINWFVRLIDARDPSDNTARAMLFRDLAALLIKPARFVTSTPLELYQSLLMRFGFKLLDLPAQHDFGKDRPAPFFELDLRGERLAQHLRGLMKQHIGVETDLPFESLLATLSPNNQGTNSTTESQAAATEKAAPICLDVLTEREREVALAAVEGLPNCSIASRLDIGEVTVKKHMSQIFRKLAVRNRGELIKRFWSEE